MKQPKQKKLLVFVLALAIILSVAGFFFVGFGQYHKNLAAELASPMEKALIDKGGIEICKDGDNGRGPDNRRPWYQVFTRCL